MVAAVRDTRDRTRLEVKILEGYYVFILDMCSFARHAIILWGAHHEAVNRSEGRSLDFVSTIFLLLDRTIHLSILFVETLGIACSHA